MRIRSGIRDVTELLGEAWPGPAWPGLTWTCKEQHVLKKKNLLVKVLSLSQATFCHIGKRALMPEAR